MEVKTKKNPLFNFSQEQQFLFTMMMIDPSDKTIPTIQNPEWVDKLELDLTKLFKDGTLKKMYFDNNGIVHVE